MQDFFVGQSTNITLAAQKAAEESGANESVVILITGFVVVFLVLLLLIGVIKIYSGIVSSVQKKVTEKKTKKEEAKLPQTAVVAEGPSQTAETFNEGLDLQTVAVITAAVEAYYSKGKKVRITNIRPSNNNRNEWASAGLAQNIPAMRWEGLL